MKNISLSTATMFLINVVFGTNLFLNTKILISNLGDKSYYVYLMAAFVIFPLIYAVALLSSFYPGKGIYELISILNKNLSFSITWAYSISKIFAATISFLFGLEFLCFMLKAPKNSIYYIFTFFTFFFIWSIYKNYSLEDLIQRCISTFKFIPVLTIIILGFFSIKNGTLYQEFFTKSYNFAGINDFLKAIPIVILSFSGFENIFSIASNIKNPEISFKSVIYSFFSVFTIYFLYQSVVSKIIPINKITGANSFAEIYYLILKKVNVSEYFINILMIIAAFSILGGVYNTLYANTNHIYLLLKRKNFDYSFIVFSIGLIVFFYGIFLGKNIIYTQQISALATITIYTCVALIYFKLPNKNSTIDYLFKFLLFFSIISLFVSIIKSISLIGYFGYLIYSLIILSGFILLYFIDF